mmetsp:Transcript_1581/g.9763  ORF Transcript_1581/g.9763 Transcript_1581/m.9763 type:complete len:288 (-) Transcript_1581:191-1054(-)
MKILLQCILYACNPAQHHQRMLKRLRMPIDAHHFPALRCPHFQIIPFWIRTFPKHATDTLTQPRRVSPIRASFGAWFFRCHGSPFQRFLASHAFGTFHAHVDGHPALRWQRWIHFDFLGQSHIDEFGQGSRRRTWLVAWWQYHAFPVFLPFVGTWMVRCIQRRQCAAQLQIWMNGNQRTSQVLRHLQVLQHAGKEGGRFGMARRSVVQVIVHHHFVHVEDGHCTCDLSRQCGLEIELLRVFDDGTGHSDGHGPWTASIRHVLFLPLCFWCVANVRFPPSLPLLSLFS